MRPRTAIVGAAGLGVLVVAGIVAFGGGGSDDATAVSTELRAIDPLLVEHTTIDRLECPAGRGTSPLADAEHSQGINEVDGGYAEGQLAPFTLRLQASSSATDPIEIVYDTTASPALGGELQCVFVDTSDSEHLEQPEGEPAAVELVDDQLTVSGLEPGESLVVEIWTTISADQDADAAVTLDFTPTPTSIAQPASIMFDTEFGRVGLADDEATIELSATSNLVELGGAITATVTVANPSEVDALSRAVLMGTVGANATVDSIGVTDQVGFVSQCESRDDTWQCDLGFLAPDEEVVVTVGLTSTNAEPPESGGVVQSDAICSRRVPRICHRVELTYLDTFDTATTDAEQEVRITTEGSFTARLVQDPDTGVRLGDEVDFELSIFVNSDTESADSISVEFTPCPLGLQLVRGDANDDNTMEPGETWVYECTSESLPETTALVSIRGEIGDNRRGDTLVALALAAYDARMTLTPIRVVEGSSWDLANIGQVDLTNVTLNRFGDTDCTPEYLTGDANSDSVLQPGEVWQFDCSAVDAEASARADDPFGRVVEARIPPPEPDN